MSKLNILVIEDNAAHAEAAREQLAEHEVRIVRSFPAALRVLGSYQLNAISEKGDECSTTFDVVLTDMELPIMRTSSFSSVPTDEQSAPFGLIIALRAAQVGVKYVAMVTDTNHHSTAMSNAIDMIAPAYFPGDSRSALSIGTSKVLFVHAKTQDNGRGVSVKQWREVLDALLK